MASASATKSAHRSHPGGHPRSQGTGWRSVVAGLLARVKADDVPSLAAGIAFKIFLSLFPALLAAIAIFSYVVDPVEIAAKLRPVLPPGFVSEIVEERLVGIAADRGAAVVALIAGALGGLWAASSAAVTLIKALDRIHGVSEQRGFVAQRAVALLVIAGLLVVLTVVTALVVLGPQLRDTLLPPQLGTAGSALFTAGQIAAAAAALMLLFAFVYWLAPNRERSQWRWWSAGSVAGVVAWLVLSLAFSAFVQTLGNYEETYGSLAAVALTMLWLQLSMMVVLLGAEVDVQLERQRETSEALVEGAGMSVLVPPPAPTVTDEGPGHPNGDSVGGIDPRRVPRTTAAVAGLGALALVIAVAVRGRQ